MQKVLLEHPRPEEHALFCNHNLDLKKNLNKSHKINRKVLNECKFQCYFCLKNFQQNAALFAHIKRHTGEFCVSCVGCKVQFNYRDLWKHKRVCIKSRQLLVCPFCNSSSTCKELKEFICNGWKCEELLSLSPHRTTMRRIKRYFRFGNSPFKLIVLGQDTINPNFERKLYLLNLENSEYYN